MGTDVLYMYDGTFEAGSLGFKQAKEAVDEAAFNRTKNAMLSCSLLPICPCIKTRLIWRVMLTSVDASLLLVVMALSWRRGGRPSYSSHGMWLASLRTRSVGSLSGLYSSASSG